MVNGELSRRGFIGSALAGGTLAALGLSGCASDPKTASDVQGDTAVTQSDWLGSEPETPSEFAQELECDVVVCGLGYAGVSAVRAAAEEGASVVAFEKGSDFGLDSSVFAVFGSKLWLEKFPEFEKFFNMRAEMINEVNKGCLYRNKGALLNRWADLNGDTFEWFVSAMPGLEWGTAENGNKVSEDAEYSITEATYPIPANYDPANENMPCFPGSARMGGTAQKGFLNATLTAAEEASDVTVMRNTPAVKLIKDESGKVSGVIAQNADGEYIKATALKGVVLATGDFMNNGDMLAEFLPQILEDGYEPFGEGNYYTVADAEGKSCNTGDGHKMASWAGAAMQDYGCAMSHCVMGSASGVFGTLPFLMINVKGERFFNEDVQGQQYAEQIRQQPDMKAFQIFDGAWADEMDDMPYGHGKYPSSTTQEAIDAAVEEGGIIKADTIEELCQAIDGLDAERAIETINRYNEFCETGEDLDFAKASNRLFPLSTPPYYAITHGKGDNLVTMSGIECDTECRALDANYEPVPGLYVAGNVQGGRFAVIYPEVMQGHSVSMAVVFGRLAGQNAANAI